MEMLKFKDFDDKTPVYICKDKIITVYETKIPTEDDKFYLATTINYGLGYVNICESIETVIKMIDS